MSKTAKPRKHGNRWQINYLDALGTRQYETFPTNKEAMQALRQHQAEQDAIRSGAKVAPPAAHTFSELAALWMEVKYSKRSLAEDESIIRNHLTPAFGTRVLTTINPTLIAAFERRMAGGHAVNTVRNALSLLRAMFNLGREHGWVTVVPKVKLPRASEQEFHYIQTAEEIRRFLDVARSDGYPGLMPFYATAIYTGMRAGELCGLTWNDVNLDLRSITVQRSFKGPTKSGYNRHVPILDPLLAVLREWRVTTGGEGVVFQNGLGKMHVEGARIMRQVYHSCLELAEISDPDLTFHGLRHTFASHWVLRGGDIFKLKEILGHSDMKLTMRYAHLAPAAFEADYGRFLDLVPRERAGEVIEMPLGSAGGKSR